MVASRPFIAILHHVNLQGFGQGQNVLDTKFVQVACHENVDSVVTVLFNWLERGYTILLQDLKDNLNVVIFQNFSKRVPLSYDANRGPIYDTEWVSKVHKGQIFTLYVKECCLLTLHVKQTTF